MTRTDGAGQRPSVKVARDLDIADEFLEPYGRDKAKVRLEAIAASGRKRHARGTGPCVRLLREPQRPLRHGQRVR